MAHPWFEVAEREIGVTEIPGSRSNPRIEEYHEATLLGKSDDDVSWCASFVNWCLLQAGIEGTNSPAARSFLDWGKEIKEPENGCIVIFKRGTSSWQGHVGFYAGQSRDKIAVLGGNQSDQVKISLYSKADLLGYRMPKHAILPMVTLMGEKTWDAGSQFSRFFSRVLRFLTGKSGRQGPL